VELLDSGVIEVRALADGATHSGYFDDHNTLPVEKDEPCHICGVGKTVYRLREAQAETWETRTW